MDIYYPCNDLCKSELLYQVSLVTLIAGEQAHEADAAMQLCIGARVVTVVVL